MPPVVAAAGIAAAGAIGGGLISSSATKKAANAQSQAAADQIAAAKENRDYQYNLNQPTITQGGVAAGNISALLGLGGDVGASEAALARYRDSTGYRDLVNEGLGAVNANAYARGTADSGATLKALQDRGSTIAKWSMGDYLDRLTGVASRGDQARGLVAGVGLNTTSAINNATQTAANGRSNAALANGANQMGLIQNLLNAGAYAYGSSYGGGSSGGGAYGIRGSDGIY